MLDNPSESFNLSRPCARKSCGKSLYQVAGILHILALFSVFE